MLLIEFKNCLDLYEAERSYWSFMFGRNLDIESLMSYYAFLKTHSLPDDELSMRQIMPIFKIMCTVKDTSEKSANESFKALRKSMQMPGNVNAFPDAFYNSKIHTLTNWEYIYNNRNDIEKVTYTLNQFFGLSDDFKEALGKCDFKDIVGIFTLPKEIVKYCLEALHPLDLINSKNINLLLSSPKKACDIAQVIYYANHSNYACIHEEVMQDVMSFSENILQMYCIFWNTHKNSLYSTDDLIADWRLIKANFKYSTDIAIFLCNFIAGEANNEWMRLIYQYPDVFVSEEVCFVCRTGEIKLTLEQFRQIVNYVNPLANITINIQRVIEKIYSLRVALANPAPSTKIKKLTGRVNDPQSVHNDQIERSVRRSLLNLKLLYPEAIKDNCSRNIAEIESFSLTLNVDDLRESAAERAIYRCLTELRDTQINPDSSMTISQCLSLIWQAANDEKKLLPGSTLKLAKESLVESLYQIQRSYNIDENDKDTLSDADKISCDFGIANMLVSGQNGIHSAVEMVFMSLESAGIKVKGLTLKAVKDYLTVCKNKTPESFPALLGELKAKGVEVIFNKIHHQISDELFNEYKSLFITKNADFDAIVATAVDVDIDKILKGFENASIAKVSIFAKVEIENPQEKCKTNREEMKNGI